MLLVGAGGCEPPETVRRLQAFEAAEAGDVGALVAALQDSDEVTRLTAVRGLAARPEPEASRALRDWVVGADEPWRRELLVTLLERERTDAGAVALLELLMADESPRVRLAAVRGLGLWETVPEPLAGRVVGRLGDEEVAVAQGAQDTLVELGWSVVDAMVAGLPGADPERARRLRRALTTITGDVIQDWPAWLDSEFGQLARLRATGTWPEAREALAKGLASEEADVRLAAGRALAALAPRDEAVAMVLEIGGVRGADLTALWGRTYDEELLALAEREVSGLDATSAGALMRAVSWRSHTPMLERLARAPAAARLAALLALEEQVEQPDTKPWFGLDALAPLAEGGGPAALASQRWLEWRFGRYTPGPGGTSEALAAALSTEDDLDRWWRYVQAAAELAGWLGDDRLAASLRSALDGPADSHHAKAASYALARVAPLGASDALVARSLELAAEAPDYGKLVMKLSPAYPEARRLALWDAVAVTLDAPWRRQLLEWLTACRDRAAVIAHVRRWRDGATSSEARADFEEGLVRVGDEVAIAEAKARLIACEAIGEPLTMALVDQGAVRRAELPGAAVTKRVELALLVQEAGSRRDRDSALRLAEALGEWQPWYARQRLAALTDEARLVVGAQLANAHVEAEEASTAQALFDAMTHLVRAEDFDPPEPSGALAAWLALTRAPERTRRQRQETLAALIVRADELERRDVVRRLVARLASEPLESGVVTPELLGAAAEAGKCDLLTREAEAVAVHRRASDLNTLAWAVVRCPRATPEQLDRALAWALAAAKATPDGAVLDTLAAVMSRRPETRGQAFAVQQRALRAVPHDEGMAKRLRKYLAGQPATGFEEDER